MGFDLGLVCKVCKKQITISRLGTNESPDKNMWQFLARHYDCKTKEDECDNFAIVAPDWMEGSDYPLEDFKDVESEDKVRDDCFLNITKYRLKLINKEELFENLEHSLKDEFVMPCRARSC